MKMSDNIRPLGAALVVCIGLVVTYYVVAAGFTTLFALSIAAPTWVVVIVVLAIWRARCKLTRN